ncbi:MAG: hypothetical protein WBA93_11510 [Microcoleaceae cyanobacterium]
MINYNRKILLLISALLFSGISYLTYKSILRPSSPSLLSPAIAINSQDCTAMIPPIRNGYGALGIHSVSRETFPSPLWRFKQVHVYYPSGVNSPVPVIFFAHAYGAIYPKLYDALIQHIVSQGYALVYSPYKGNIAHRDRYEMLWSGFESAVKNYPEKFDLDRIGFMGHSYGGGAIPALAYRGIVEKQWGRQGAFLFIMAPYYSFEINNEQLQRLPPQTKLLLQVYEEDRVNDHRIAINLFNQFTFPTDEKNYVMIRSDQNLNCRLVADHETPLSSGLIRKKIVVNGLDYYGVYRLFDALADYTFYGSLNGKSVALGPQSDRQTYMGSWPDGVEVKRLISTRSPQPIQNSSFYRYSVTD